MGQLADLRPGGLDGSSLGSAVLGGLGRDWDWWAGLPTTGVP